MEATEEAPADCAPVAWFDQFGGPADQAVRGTTFDTQGNIWITGKTTEALDGPHDGDLAADFARKYSPQGEVVWTKQGTGGSIGWHVRLDSDGNLYNTVTTRTADIPSEAEIIGGGGFGDCALRKYSPAGELLWERYLGGAKDDICYLELSNGRPIVFGSSEGDIYNQNGVRAEAVLTTFDEEGNPLWHTVYDTNDDDYFFDLATTPQGNMLVLAGVSYGCCNGIGRTHQIELTPNGEVVDDRILFSAYEFASEIEIDAAGNRYYTSDFEGRDEQVLYKYDAAGLALWSKPLRLDGVPSLTLLPNGAPVIAGELKGKVWMQSWSSDGEPRKSFHFGTGADLVKSISASPRGEVAVAGYTFGSFAGHQNPNTNSSDGMLFVFPPDTF